MCYSNSMYALLSKCNSLLNVHVVIKHQEEVVYSLCCAGGYSQGSVNGDQW